MNIPGDPPTRNLRGFWGELRPRALREPVRTVNERTSTWLERLQVPQLLLVPRALQTLPVRRSQ